MALNRRRVAQAFAGMALIGLLLVSAPATACIRSHHGGMMGSASNVPQDPVVTHSNQITVEIKGYDFVPRDLTVPVGATVTWVMYLEVDEVHDSVKKALSRQPAGGS